MYREPVMKITVIMTNGRLVTVCAVCIRRLPIYNKGIFFFISTCYTLQEIIILHTYTHARTMLFSNKYWKTDKKITIASPTDSDGDDYNIILTVKTRFSTVFVRVKSWVLFRSSIQEECDPNVRVAHTTCFALLQPTVVSSPVYLPIYLVMLLYYVIFIYNVIVSTRARTVPSSRYFRFRSSRTTHELWLYMYRSPSGPRIFLKWACQ